MGLGFSWRSAYERRWGCTGGQQSGRQHRFWGRPSSSPTRASYCPRDLGHLWNGEVMVLVLAVMLCVGPEG